MSQSDSSSNIPYNNQLKSLITRTKFGINDIETSMKFVHIVITVSTIFVAFNLPKTYENTLLIFITLCFTLTIVIGTSLEILYTLANYTAQKIMLIENQVDDSAALSAFNDFQNKSLTLLPKKFDTPKDLEEYIGNIKITIIFKIMLIGLILFFVIGLTTIIIILIWMNFEFNSLFSCIALFILFLLCLFLLYMFFLVIRKYINSLWIQLNSSIKMRRDTKKKQQKIKNNPKKR